MKRIVIIGATSSIAENCARLWVKERVNLVLVGRNLERLNAIAQDLVVRNPRAVISTKVSGFTDVSDIEATVAQICSEGLVDVVLIAHGALPEQGACQKDLHLNQATLEINGISPMLFAEAFVQKMLPTNLGTVAIIGSVAGDRGRKSNYVYGAAKGLVTRYAQGLQHRLASTRIKVLLVKPGPTDTPMTQEFKAQGVKLADPERVAKEIVAAIAKNKSSTIYTPSKWRLIMTVLQHVPAFIFNKLDI